MKSIRPQAISIKLPNKSEITAIARGKHWTKAIHMIPIQKEYSIESLMISYVLRKSHFDFKLRF